MPETCDRCNGPVNSGDTFCGNCGNVLATTTPHVPPQPVPDFTPASPPVAPPPMNPASNRPPPAPPPPARRPGPPRPGPGQVPDLAITRRNIIYSDEMDSRSTFDPLTNPRFLRQLGFRFLIYTSVTGFIDTTVLVLTLILARSAILGVIGTVAPLSWLIVVVLFWVLPVPALIGQRTQLLTHRAAVAPRVFGYISHAFDEHATPRDSLQVRKITPPGQDRRGYLELRDGLFTGYVSCFGHGTDLYFGWTFWLRVSPIRVAFMRLGRNVQNYSGRGGDIYQTFRWESAKASVGAIQACMLDGIEAAVNEMDGTSGVSLPESAEQIMAKISDESAPDQQKPDMAAAAEIARRAMTRGL
jgi:hypothetical protein